MVEPADGSGPAHPGGGYRRLDDGAAAVLAAAEEFDLERPVLVGVYGAALWRAGDIAVRVERASTEARTLLELVRVAGLAGVPVAPPVCAEPFEHAAGQVTFWRWIETAPKGGADLRCFGGAIRALHREVAAERWLSAGARPILETFDRRLQNNVDELAAAGFDRSVVQFLRREAAAWTEVAGSTLPTPLGQVALHGDPHPGNVIDTAAGCVLVDWEFASVGPGEWDHAHVLMHVRRGRAPQRRYDEFALGYGEDIRSWNGTEAWVRLHEVLATARMATASLRDPGLAPRLEERLAWWE